MTVVSLHFDNIGPCANSKFDPPRRFYVICSSSHFLDTPHMKTDMLHNTFVVMLVSLLTFASLSTCNSIEALTKNESSYTESKKYMNSHQVPNMPNVGGFDYRSDATELLYSEVLKNTNTFVFLVFSRIKLTSFNDSTFVFTTLLLSWLLRF